MADATNTPNNSGEGARQEIKEIVLDWIDGLERFYVTDIQVADVDLLVETLRDWGTKRLECTKIRPALYDESRGENQS